MCCSHKVKKTDGKSEVTTHVASSPPPFGKSAKHEKSHQRTTFHIQPIPSPLRNNSTYTSGNPRLICVKNLPKVVQADHLLNFLNRTMGEALFPAIGCCRARGKNSGPIVQNCLVFHQVAIVCFISPVFVDFLLNKLQNGSIRPLQYGGRRLSIRRPRNYVGGREETRSEGRTHEHAIPDADASSSSNDQLTNDRTVD